MVRSILKYHLILLTLMSAQFGSAQHLLSDVRLSKSSVYLGEPVEVEVSIFTSTWYTAGLDIPNIKVNDAFTVPFRTVSTSKQVNGKTYAGLLMIYNVFPYTEADVEFPSLSITVETPDDGDFKGVKRTVKTPARTIKVRPIPQGVEKEEWFVASGLSVSEKWNGDLKAVKVGDVIERTIYRNAPRTVSELIPPIVWDTIAGIGLYPGRSTTKNNRSRTTFSAERSDRMRYLFMEEGEVIIPEQTIYWWNAGQGRIYKKTLKKIAIDVQPNPDLGMLASIKDSLDMMAATMPVIGTEEEKPFSFLGMDWKQLSLAVLVLLFLLKYAPRFFRYLRTGYREKRNAYLNSEVYYFDRFIKSLSGTETEKRNALYRWLDCLELREYTLAYFNSRFDPGAEPPLAIKSSKRHWKAARQRYMQSMDRKVSVRRNWVNP